MDLSGKVAVVTGGSRGLGLELSRCFVARGAKVVVASWSAADASAAARGLGAAMGLACDVRRRSDVDQLMSRAALVEWPSTPGGGCCSGHCERCSGGPLS